MDRAKLIKAIECRKEARKRCGNPCEETGACAYARCVTDGNRTYLPYYCDVEQICEDALTLLKEQERHGRWIPVDPNKYDFAIEWCCSECDKDVLIAEYDKECSYAFCPNCGAKMDLEVNDGT